ncbi:hypothetical protein RFI_19600, partial [Reticulomyxa filosa]
RQWNVLLVSQINENTFVTVSEINADNSKSNWWDALVADKATTSNDNSNSNNNNNNSNNNDNNNSDSGKKDDEKNENETGDRLLGKINLWQWHRGDDNTSVKTSESDAKSAHDTTSTSTSISSNGQTDGNANKVTTTAPVYLESPTSDNYLRVTSNAMDSNNPSDCRHRPLFTCHMKLSRPKSAYFHKECNLLLVGTEYGILLLFTYFPDKQVRVHVIE